MCGIVGFIDINEYINYSPQIIIREMADSLLHRGPDDGGVWISDSFPFALGHRRLSILDLTQAGHQPKYSSSGRYIMIFNGEIYNHIELREKLNTTNWQGTSDTETLLECFDKWGIFKTIENITGMFSIVVSDLHDRKLYLFRDRMGEKPLYFYKTDLTLVFGSELKSLNIHPSVSTKIDLTALSFYIHNGYINESLSIYNEIKKIGPGGYLICDYSESGRLSYKQGQYWNIYNIVTESKKNLFEGNNVQASDQLELLLKKAVKNQLISDVSLGAFLSGGTDSSLIVALMQSVSSLPVKTFTIGFSEQEYNEAHYAKVIAEYLKTDHTELYLSSKDALDVVPLIANIYDEPFADPSQIPTFLVSKLAHNKVSVALTGDGGDELFLGYDRYNNTLQQWNKLRKIPLSIRKFVSYFGTYHPYSKGFRSRNIIDFYAFINDQWKGNDNVLLQDNYTGVTENLKISDELERLSLLDQVSYLPCNILTKVDRAAMSNSLETRVPMLDHKVVEFSWRLAPKFKSPNGVPKGILKNILYRYIPKKLIDRPKMGFGVPIDHWLRNELRDWAGDLLSESNLAHMNLFNTKLITKYWNEHLSGKYNRHYSLWTLLMFIEWYQKSKKI